MANLSQASIPVGAARCRLVVAVLIASVLASLDLFVVNLAFAAIAEHFPDASTQDGLPAAA